MGICCVPRVDMGSGAQLWPVQRLEGTSERERGGVGLPVGSMAGSSVKLFLPPWKEEKTPHVCPGPKCTF